MFILFSIIIFILIFSWTEIYRKEHWLRALNNFIFNVTKSTTQIFIFIWTFRNLRFLHIFFQCNKAIKNVTNYKRSIFFDVYSSMLWHGKILNCQSTTKSTRVCFSKYTLHGNFFINLEHFGWLTCRVVFL